MAAALYTLKIAGFTSGGDPTTGSGHIANTTITVWDDGSVHYTDGASVARTIARSPELNDLLKLIVVGGSGIPTTKVWVDV